jgi:hypothetical protein
MDWSRLSIAENHKHNVTAQQIQHCLTATQSSDVLNANPVTASPTEIYHNKKQRGLM